MAFPRLLSLPSHVIGLCFVLGYVALDWISFVHSFGPFGITPWNPPTGLSFVLILLFVAYELWGTRSEEHTLNSSHYQQSRMPSSA